MKEPNSVKFIRYKSLPSTNQKLYQLAEQGAEAFTVVWCDAQTHGKGYAGNQWLSPDNQNLTFSFLLKNLDLKDQAYLNRWVANCLHQFLTDWQFPVKVKWPNDLILNRKKLGGILIENRIKHDKIDFSVIGIGLNVFQRDFGMLNATSLACFNADFNEDLAQLLEQIMSVFSQNYHLILDKKFDEINDYYLKSLFVKDQVATYEHNGILQNGILRGITPDGKALIELENKPIQSFAHKEIRLLY